MWIVLVVIVIILIIVLVCWLFITIEQRERRRSISKLMHWLSQAGSQYQLSFSSQVMLKRNVLGLDGVHRKLLLLTVMDNGRCKDRVVDLNQVKSCSVRKVYGAIQPEAFNYGQLDTYLQTIVLHFELVDDLPPIEIPFYNAMECPAYERVELEQKAMDWEAMLSKLLKAPSKRRA